VLVVAALKSTATFVVCVCASALAGWVACGGSTPAPASPAQSNDANRPLTAAECQSLGDYLREACTHSANERSATAESWCSDLVTHIENGSWVDGDCIKHIRYMDAECMRSAGNAHGIMDCNRMVDRSQ
jgi:hypothetical protein